MPMPMRVLTMNARATKTGRKDARASRVSAAGRRERTADGLTGGDGAHGGGETRHEGGAGDGGHGANRREGARNTVCHAAIFMFMFKARLTQRQLTRIRAEAFCYWARISISICAICAFSLKENDLKHATVFLTDYRKTISRRRWRASDWAPPPPRASTSPPRAPAARPARARPART